MELISAQKARSNCDSLLITVNKEALNDLASRIHTASSNGQGYILYYDPIPDVVRAELQIKGYVWENLSDARDGTCYKISW